MVKTNLHITKMFLNPAAIEKGNTSNASQSSQEQDTVHSSIPLQMRTVEGELIPVAQSTSSQEAQVEISTSKEITLYTGSTIPTRKRKLIGEEDEPDETLEEGDEQMVRGTPAVVPPSTSTEKGNKRYILGFSIDLPWCVSQNFSELLDVFRFQDWIPLFSESFNNPLYPNAMHELCENWNMANGTCSSTVGGVDLKFDAKFLGRLFLVPTEGFDKYFKGKLDLTIGDANKDDIILSLGGTKGQNKIDHKALSPFHKLLLNFVWRAIIPRSQKRNQANLLDCAIIYCLANKIPINFPSLMIQHLSHTVPSGLQVGYGALFTCLFVNSNVPLNTYGFYPQKDAHILKDITMKNLSLGIKEGKTVSIKGGSVQGSFSKKSAKASRKRTAPALKIEEPVETGVRKEQVTGKRKQIDYASPDHTHATRARRSFRLAAFRKPNPPITPETVILDDDIEVLVGLTGEGSHQGAGTDLGEQEQSEQVLDDPVPDMVGEEQTVNISEPSVDISQTEAGLVEPQQEQEHIGTTGENQTPVTKIQVVQAHDPSEILPSTNSQEDQVVEGTTAASGAFPEPLTEPLPTITIAPPVPQPFLQLGVPSSFSAGFGSTFSSPTLEALLKPIHEKLDKVLAQQEQHQKQLNSLQQEFSSLSSTVTSTHEELTQKMDEMVFEPLPATYPNNPFP